jgi:hypothetical protein
MVFGESAAGSGAIRKCKEVKGRSAEQEAYRLARLREVMRRPRSEQWKANQRAGVRKAVLLGKYQGKRSAASIEAGAAKLRGRKRPPEVVAKVAEANRGKNLFRKHSAAVKERVSEGLKAYWANLDSSERARRVAHIVGVAKANRGRKPDPAQGLIHSLKMWGRPRDPDAAQRAARTMRGRAQRAERTRKGQTHHHSRRAQLKSPDGKLFQVINITDFVRSHLELFAPEDIVWKRLTKKSNPHGLGSERCRASHGLLQLFCTNPKHRRSSWKGWTTTEEEVGRND